MARLTDEQYKIKDLEVKFHMLKELRLLNTILAYKYGPGELQLLGDLEEVIKNEFKVNGSKSNN